LLSSPHLIQDLRRVDLTIAIDRRDTVGVAIYLVRIDHSVKMIKQHAVDKDKKPLLRRLHVRLVSKYGLKEHLYPDMVPQLPARARSIRKHTFILERFAEFT
jgi:hypothetical protein